jgi:hypothetical protein
MFETIGVGQVPLTDWGAGSRGRDSAFDPARERIGRIYARRGDGRGCYDAPLHHWRKPIDRDYSLSRQGRRLVGKTPANDESFSGVKLKMSVGDGNSTGGIHD